MNLFKKIVLTLSIILIAGTSSAMAQGTDFFGIPGNPQIDEDILNGPDEEAAGQQNQGWDGATGEVVPTPDEDYTPPPEVPDPVPVED